MNNQLLNDGADGARALTRKMVHDRTRELAMAAGRAPFDVTHADYQRARRDITGESEFDRQDRVLNAWPRSNPARRVAVDAVITDHRLP